MITCLLPPRNLQTLPPSGGGCPAGGEGAGPVVMVKHFPRGLAEAGAAGRTAADSVSRLAQDLPLTGSATGKMSPLCFSIVLQ